jgi:hypothetical protein
MDKSDPLLSTSKDDCHCAECLDWVLLATDTKLQAGRLSKSIPPVQDVGMSLFPKRCLDGLVPHCSAESR